MRHLPLALALIVLCGCGHPERYGCDIAKNGTYKCLDGTGGTLPQGPAGLDGASGQDGQPGDACTVQDTENGAVIVCPDGSSVELFDGTDGEDGHTVTLVCHRHGHHRVCVRR